MIEIAAVMVIVVDVICSSFAPASFAILRPSEAFARLDT